MVTSSDTDMFRLNSFANSCSFAISRPALQEFQTLAPLYHTFKESVGPLGLERHSVISRWYQANHVELLCCSTLFPAFFVQNLQLYQNDSRPKLGKILCGGGLDSFLVKPSII